MKTVVFAVISVVTLATAQADDSAILQRLDAMQSSIRQLERRLSDQEKEIEVLKNENETLRAVAGQGQSPTGAAESTNFHPGNAAKSSTGRTTVKNLSAFNPEIGVVGDIVGTLTENSEDAEGNDRLAVREVEFIVGHDIDPYSRFDGTFTISDFEEFGIEEAYLTHFGLPGVTARLGRMRQRIDLASSLHRDQLETVDEPLVVQRYLGVEGYFKTGMELSSFLPTFSAHLTPELIAGIAEGGIGEEGELFGESRRRPTLYTRLKSGIDISDETSGHLAGTFMMGSSDEDSAYESRAFVVDAALNHHWATNRRLTLKSEFIFQDRSANPSERVDHEHGVVIPRAADESLAKIHENPWGAFLLADLRFLERWSVGTRWDYVEPSAFDDDAVRSGDVAWNGFATFYQSEFARFRFQYQHVDFAEGGDDERFFLQTTFAIGVHKHKLQ